LQCARHVAPVIASLRAIALGSLGRRRRCQRRQDRMRLSRARARDFRSGLQDVRLRAATEFPQAREQAFRSTSGMSGSTRDARSSTRTPPERRQGAAAANTSRVRANAYGGSKKITSNEPSGASRAKRPVANSASTSPEQIV
jgi:hypothetical protein